MTPHNKSKFGTPASHDICVIYDPGSGRIVHTHQHVTYPGGAKVTAKEVEAEGLAALGRRLKTDVKGFKTIHVDSKEYEEGSRYRIDPSSHRLIKVLSFPG